MTIRYAILAPAFMPLLDSAFRETLTAAGRIILCCLVIGLLLLICLSDVATMEIPNGLTVALLACGVLSAFVLPELTLTSRLIGLVCISLPLLIISLIAPGAFGGGDIKLMAAAGFLLGWQNTLLAACIGFVIGGVYGIYLMAFNKKSAKEHFAFGPALCAGIAIALLFGTGRITGLF